ncbi:MAG: hypothetical protein ABL907_20830 [Hyphomicrobium sp.]
MTLKSFTISAGVLDVFNIDVTAPDADTALELAQSDWATSRSGNWTPCGPVAKPNFQVEQERDIPLENTKTYTVGFYVNEVLVADIQATSEDEALRIATARRDAHGAYECFDTIHSDYSEMDIRGVRS